MPVKAGFPTSIIFDKEDYELLQALKQRRGQRAKYLIADALRALDREDRAEREMDTHLEDVQRSTTG